MTKLEVPSRFVQNDIEFSLQNKTSFDRIEGVYREIGSGDIGKIGTWFLNGVPLTSCVPTIALDSLLEGSDFRQHVVYRLANRKGSNFWILAVSKNNVEVIDRYSNCGSLTFKMMFDHYDFNVGSRLWPCSKAGIKEYEKYLGASN